MMTHEERLRLRDTIWTMTHFKACDPITEQPDARREPLPELRALIDAAQARGCDEATIARLCWASITEEPMPDDGPHMLIPGPDDALLVTRKNFVLLMPGGNFKAPEEG